MAKPSTPEAVPPVPGAAGGEDVELRLTRREPLRFRAWFYSFIALLAVLVIVRFTYGSFSRAAVLSGLFAYLSIACTFCPLPTAWLIMWAAAPTVGGGLGFHPLVVASAGALATAIANLHDYYLLTFLYRYQPVRRLRTTGLYRRVSTWYNRAPFATLAAASFLPIPIDFVRLLAISEGYSRPRFVLGTLVGRWPRYFLFAFAAERFQLGWQWILGIAGATVVLGLWRGLPPLVKKLGAWRRRDAPPEETSP